MLEQIRDRAILRVDLAIREQRLHEHQLAHRHIEDLRLRLFFLFLPDLQMSESLFLLAFQLVDFLLLRFVLLHLHEFAFKRIELRVFFRNAALNPLELGR